MNFTLPRQSAFDAIDSERDYQDAQTARSDRPDMVEEMSMGDILSAIEHNLNQARQQWYRDSAPFFDTTPYLRKIGALVVKAGEQFGLPLREESQS